MSMTGPVFLERSRESVEKSTTMPFSWEDLLFSNTYLWGLNLSPYMMQIHYKLCLLYEIRKLHVSRLLDY